MSVILMEYEGIFRFPEEHLILNMLQNNEASMFFDMNYFLGYSREALIRILMERTDSVFFRWCMRNKTIYDKNNELYYWKKYFNLEKDLNYLTALKGFVMVDGYLGQPKTKAKPKIIIFSEMTEKSISIKYYKDIFSVFGNTVEFQIGKFEDIFKKENPDIVHVQNVDRLDTIKDYIKSQGKIVTFVFPKYSFNYNWSEDDSIIYKYDTNITDYLIDIYEVMQYDLSDDNFDNG